MKKIDERFWLLNKQLRYDHQRLLEFKEELKKKYQKVYPLSRLSYSDVIKYRYLQSKIKKDQKEIDKYYYDLKDDFPIIKGDKND